MRKLPIYLGTPAIFITIINAALAGQYYAQPGMQQMQPQQMQMQPAMQPQPVQPGMQSMTPAQMQNMQQQRMIFFTNNPQANEQHWEMYWKAYQEQRILFFTNNPQANEQNWEMHWNQFKAMNNVK